MNHAHVQPNGQYHYHGMLAFNRLSRDNQGMTLVGWASDGFPVYAKYGYSDPDDSTSELIALQPSWKLKEVPDNNRPDTLTVLIGGPGQEQPIQIYRFQWVLLLKTLNMMKVLEIWMNAMEE